ncbi:sensor histidine kinase [Leifsonia sp. YAF41]|uniref:sensor histidine kinase n=1 Tax=Leifsonia sp. YAF41 TaxID=3233086 RepID=UPI003F94D17C
MNRSGRSVPDSDAAAVGRASRIIGWQITAGATAIVLFLVVASVIFIVNQSQPAELLEKPKPGETRIYIDSTAVLVAVIVVGVVAIAIAGVLSWVVARRAVRPLGEALRMQRSFVADASHELRTPLTVLDARIQVLQRGLAPGDPVSPAVADIRRDTLALVAVVNDLLLVAASEAPEGATPVIDVVPVVEQAVQSMRVLGDQRGVQIEFGHEFVPDRTRAHQHDGEVLARIPAASIQRCVVALLDNAIAHSPNGSHVSVTLHASKATFDLVVADQGAGIQGIDPAHIFDRFAHSSAAEYPSANQRSGFGIGLALVRDVAVRNGGQVQLRESSPAGTTFVLTLPTAH